MMQNNMLKKLKVFQEQLIGSKQRLNMKVQKDYYNNRKKPKINLNMDEDN
jgi:hypothetical protein